MDNINNITSEDMKLIKFETIITDLRKKFEQKFELCIVDESEGQINPLKLLLGETSNNKYGQVILDKSFNSNIVLNWVCSYYDYNKYCINNDTPNKIDALIELCRVCNTCNPYIIKHGLKRNCNLSGQLIFFSLMYIAVDNDNYNEKINIISDMAYLIGFNEEMIKDWIYVVKMVLKSEKIDLNKLNTEEAKGFFQVLA